MNTVHNARVTNRYQRGQCIPEYNDVLSHVDMVLLLVLDVKIFLEVWVGFVTNLNVADVQRIDDFLNGLWFASWRGSECHDAEMWVMLHHEADNLRVCVISGPSVSLVYPRELTSAAPVSQTMHCTNL